MNPYRKILAGLPARVRSEIPFVPDMDLGPWRKLRVHPARDVAARAVVLGAVVDAASGGDREDMRFWLGAESLWEHASPREQDFLSSAEPDARTMNRFRWRQECLLVLLWALEVVDEMEPPTERWDPDDPGKLVPAPGEDTSAFLASARVRDIEEIGAMSEVIHQIQWKLNDHLSEKYGRKHPTLPIVKLDLPKGKLHDVPGGVDVDVAHERHWALNWLTADEDWDEVTTDT